MLNMSPGIMEYALKINWFILDRKYGDSGWLAFVASDSSCEGKEVWVRSIF